MNFLAACTPAELAALCEEFGEARFRARQIADFLFRQYEDRPEKMHTLPKPLQEKLLTRFPNPPCMVLQKVPSEDGAEKLLLGLHDGERIEMVLIPAADGRMTFCLSTQVGCPVRCAFCASGSHGLKRNLDCGEIVGEFLAGCREWGRRPDNIVFMGIGEGLLNFDALSKSLTLFTVPDAFAMSPRRITVSTSGYVPGMRKLANLAKEFTLAVSLHAPSDALRAKLIPENVRYPIADILDAADEYREKSGRMVTLEYVLLAGVNDGEKEAAALAKLSKEHGAKINLIAYNQTPGSSFRRPEPKTIRRFETILADAGCHVTLRCSKGGDSNAACGQLTFAQNRDDV